ncbi:hypothetical protein K435DRAFT_811974 [Dendrothele bispora CBS 962.96]|uniref:Uncharacterized protein n=1 Tax=Dendrothele bispora (strain CBS 962.96) TaxID=1314807 RepID=A0A4S8KQF5_DENBC|nr:hypothetical protein K435DRAFT_811974 [Dendrothele bispora CBS 962.96]
MPSSTRYIFHVQYNLTPDRFVNNTTIGEKRIEYSIGTANENDSEHRSAFSHSNSAGVIEACNLSGLALEVGFGVDVPEVLAVTAVCVDGTGDAKVKEFETVRVTVEGRYGSSCGKKSYWGRGWVAVVVVVKFGFVFVEIRVECRIGTGMQDRNRNRQRGQGRGMSRRRR